jgi:hypothetical protein
VCDEEREASALAQRFVAELSGVNRDVAPYVERDVDEALAAGWKIEPPEVVDGGQKESNNDKRES